MRKLILCLAAVYIGVNMLGCAEKKDKVRIQLPFIDVRMKEDGSTHVKSPSKDEKADK